MGPTHVSGLLSLKNRCIALPSRILRQFVAPMRGNFRSPYPSEAFSWSAVEIVAGIAGGNSWRADGLAMFGRIPSPNSVSVRETQLQDKKSHVFLLFV